jgi:hypothetical protein
MQGEPPGRCIPARGGVDQALNEPIRHRRRQRA